MNNTTKRLIIGAAISGLFLSGEVFSEKQEAGSDNVKGECHGVNSCKGKSDCHSQGSSCSGQNSCKGKGWISLTKKECDTKKGIFKKS